MRLALISKSRVAGLFVPLGPPPGLILTVGHVGCNCRCANLAVNAFLAPPQLYTVGIDINVKIADMAYWRLTGFERYPCGPLSCSHSIVALILERNFVHVKFPDSARNRVLTRVGESRACSRPFLISRM